MLSRFAKAEPVHCGFCQPCLPRRTPGCDMNLQHVSSNWENWRFRIAIVRLSFAYHSLSFAYHSPIVRLSFAMVRLSFDRSPIVHLSFAIVHQSFTYHSLSFTYRSPIVCYRSPIVPQRTVCKSFAGCLPHSSFVQLSSAFHLSTISRLFQKHP